MFSRLRWLRETGHIDCIQRRWIPRKPPCEGSLGFNSIGLTEVKPAIIFLSFGFAAALLVLCVEWIYHLANANCRGRKHIDLINKLIKIMCRLKQTNVNQIKQAK